MTKTLLAIFLFAAAANPQSKGGFRGSASLSLTQKAVAVGPRPSGSDSLLKLRTWLLKELKPLGPQIDVDNFTAQTPAGPVEMANIIAKFPGGSGKALVISGHYDTKSIPMVNFVGANDGGSSTGFLLEVAHSLPHEKQKDDIYLVWFDGEEAVGQWSESDSRYGSRHLAQKWTLDGTLSRVKAMINVDMIGDKDLSIVNDDNSSRSLRDLIWQIAKKLGYEKHFQGQGAGIDDDHLPFVSAGVNAIDLIDFSYGPQNSYWHTEKDTADKLSARSFQIVGDVVMKAIGELQNQ
jgi:glutaminyl-peptide cyclotransferase